MKAQKQLRKPQSWQDFEKLCKKLWGEVWCCPNIKQNGRQGQNQNGVDIFGVPSGEKAYFGIQCKLKDGYIDSKLSKKEIDSEIEKAKSFSPPLKQLIFATTANKDAEIETYIREKNIANLQQGLFSVDVFSWEDIVDLIEEHRTVYNWYVNDCQYKDSTNVQIFLRENVIHPKYVRKTKHYDYSPPSRVSMFPMEYSLNVPPIRFADFGTRMVDYRWQDIQVVIKNVGSTAVTDYKLYLYFDADGVEQLSDKFHYENSIYLSDAVKASINDKLDKEREVYETTSPFEIHIIPKQNILVQTDDDSFTIGVKPKDNVSEIKVEWDFKSKDYNKTGQFIISVVPDYEDEVEVINVESYSEVKPDELIVIPKIVEK